MRVRLLTGIAGANFSYGPGDIADFDAAEAKRLIAAGYAEEIRVETATNEKREKATKPKAKKR